MKAALKRHTRELLKGSPGHRFQDRYERAKKGKSSGTSLKRIINLALALVALAVGVVLVFIPGPAILFFFIGGGLLASESRWVARAMDWLELKGRSVLAWCRRYWKRRSKVARAALIGAGACVSVVTTYACWQLMRA